MKKTKRLLARAFVIALSMSGATTFTSNAVAQDDVATQMARERFQEGVKYYDQKQYEKARAAFLQAYTLKKHPSVLLNLAQSELRSAHEADAAKHFARYSRETPGGSATERSEAEKGLAAAKVKVAEFAVSVELEGAEVHVDGKFEGRSPLPGPIYLTPGTHSLEARKDGKTATLSVTATAGQTSTASLAFSSPSAAGGAPAVVPGPGGGPATGPGGPAPGGGPAGPGAGGSGSVGFDTSDEREPFFSWVAKTPLAWVGGGVTVLGLTGGVAFAVSSSSNYDSADSLRNQILVDSKARGVTAPCNPANVVTYGNACQKFQDRVDSGDSQKTLSTVSFVVAGLAAGGTVLYYFLDSKKKSSESATPAPKRSIAVVPVVAPKFGGIGIMGHL